MRSPLRHQILVAISLVCSSSGFCLPALAGYDSSVPKSYVPGLLSDGPDSYFAKLNGGWYDEQYASLKAKLSPGRSYLVLHNRLPSTPLDLRDPNGFRQSVFDLGLLNMKTLDIGHVMIGWHCEIDGKVYEGNTGITGEQEDQQTAMSKSGWGITGLFSVFKDGHLQTPLLVRSVFRQALAKKPVTTLAFEVEPEQCGKMLSFLDEFLRHPRQPYKRFGLNADPLKFEGGGCGSFGASAIATSGAIDGIFPHLWRNLAANPRIFGYGLPNLPSEIEPYAVPRSFGTSYSVGRLRGLFLMNWNPSSRGAISIRLMDPELLYLMQHTLFRASLDDVYRDSLRLGRALIASPFVRNRVLKTGEQKIDARFDRTAAAVVEESKRWHRDMKNKGYRARGFEFNGHPAVLLTR